MTRSSQTEGAGNRSITVSILGGLSLLLLAVTIFAVASQARNLSTQAEQAVQTGEILRVVSVARAELGIASRVAEISPEQTLVIDGAIDNAMSALDAVEENLSNEDLDIAASEEILEAFTDFRSAVDAQATQVTENADDLEASQNAELATGEAFTILFDELRADQETTIDGLQADNDLMNLIATAATFIVAFVVPSAGILIFQALRSTPRELRRLQLDHDRLQARSTSMANRVSDEAAKLRSDLFYGPKKISTDKVARSLLRFESISSYNGAATSIRNERLKVNEVVEDVVDQIDSKSLVKVGRGSNWVAFGDREQWGLVIAELVSNAIVHGSTPIRTLVKADGDYVELHVEDNGPGLDDEVTAALLNEEDFDLRVDTDAGEYGLGLVAARRSVEAMGGTLRYERDADKTRMIASLPLARGENVRQSDSAEPEEPGDGDGNITLAA